MKTTLSSVFGARALLAEDPLLRLAAERSLLFWLRLLAFLSGAASFIFQALWIRLFANIVGSTPAAMTCVLAALLLAPAAGALAAARLRTAGRRALLLCGGLHAAIGITGVGVVWLLVNTGGAVAALLPAAGAARILGNLAATAVLLGPAAALMGMNLPVLLSALKEKFSPSAEAHRLYGAGMLGAAAGALAAGWVLLRLYGVTGTAALALAVNGVIALAAWLLSRRLKPRKTIGVPRRAFSPAAALGKDPLWSALAFISGLTALSYELLWGRMAKLLLGDTTLTAAALHFAYLACLALGSFLAAGKAKASAPRRRDDVVLRLGAFFAAAAVLHLFGLSAARAAAGGTWRSPLALLAVGPGAVLLGAAFPLLLVRSDDIDKNPASVSGLLCGANLLGAALGAVLGGYLLPRGTGTIFSFMLISLLLALAAITLFYTSLRRNRRFIAGGAVGAAFSIAVLFLPKNLFFHPEGSSLLQGNEDEYGIQTLISTRQGLVELTNNRVRSFGKLGELGTSYAGETGAYFPCLLSRRCEDVLDIGTGYGITAGAFTRFAELRHLRTVERLPFVLKLQPLFKAYNFAYYADRRVELTHGDGRRLLANEKRTYDVISVNLPGPRLSGSSPFYTVEFWERAKSRLKPGGVYAQRIREADLPLLINELRRVFPTVLYFPARRGAFNIVAFPERTDAPAVHIERTAGAVAEALKRFGILDPAKFVRIAMADALALQTRFENAKAPAHPHNDGHPVLKYRRPHEYTD